AISVADLKQNLTNPNIIIIDVREAEDYQAGHIPGAINIDVTKLQTKSNAILKPIPKVEEILGSSGIDSSKELVLYGKEREIAFLGFWMFDYLGVPKVRILDGGIEAWKAADGRISTEAKTLPAATFRANPNASRYATVQQVLSSLKDPNVQIVDARTPDEYIGEDIRSLRGGHIPGAINIPYEENFQGEGTTLKPFDELQKLYASKLDKNKSIIVYCQTGTRSTNTYFILRELGYNVRNFDASWIQWGSNLSLPAENETFYNFAKLNKTLKELTEGGSAPTSKTEPASKTEQSPQESGSTGSAGAGPYILALIALAIGVVALLRRPKSKA
ncbi:MAG: sulfurtransferase, partial [Actinomycetota bacterium]|nr:sulfurtransferase [Actinomycetota bacterium]